MTATPRSAEETVRLGRELYEREIRGQIQDEHDGAYLAIDVESGQWGMGGDELVAVERLHTIQPDVDGHNVYLMRVGYRLVSRPGGTWQREADDALTATPRPAAETARPDREFGDREVVPMHVVELHEAESRLPELVEAAAGGEPFVIARDGVPLVKVEALDASGQRRTGFLRGHGFSVPDDFDTMGADEIEGMFEGRDHAPADAPR